MSQADRVAGVFLAMRRELRRVARRIVRPADIEDIVQETFVRAYEAELDRAIHNPRAFMLTTARNLALKHIDRCDQRLVDSMEDWGEPAAVRASPSVEAEFETREQFHAFCSAVRELPVQCRRVFILRRVYGYSQQEVAEYLKISESTVEKHVARGLLGCMAYLDARGLGPQASPESLLEVDRHV